MQFNLARLLLIIFFISFVLAATFAIPFGIPLLTFLSLFVIPPFIIVGAVNCRGLRQSFFLGAMVAGIPHFLFSFYVGYILAITLLSDGSGDASSVFADSMASIRYVNAIGYLLGTVGGISGMISYKMLKLSDKPKVRTPTEDEAIRPEIYTDVEPTTQKAFDANLPR